MIGTPKHISDAVGDALEETVGKLHATGKPFYLQFHTYAVHGPVRARPDLKKAFQAAGGKQAEYLGFIAGVDQNVKRMLELLDDPNRDGDTSDSIAANTVVFFTYYFYESEAWELYCLSDDPGEADNLIERQPEIAAWLSKKIRDWLTQQHPPWQPKYPILKTSGEPAGPPPLL